MKVLTTSIILFLCTITSTARTCEKPVPEVTSKSLQIPEYYWKDYIGIIPEDAIEGGSDDNGNPTYVGQAYFRDYELLPVIIHSGCKTAVGTAGSAEVTTDSHVKILCGKHKEKFEWVFTKHDETHLLINRHLVVGGSEVGHTINIGRVRHGKKVLIGKVFGYPLDNSGLWVPYNDAPMRFLEYDILTYNFNKKSINSSLNTECKGGLTVTINMWNNDCI